MATKHKLRAHQAKKLAQICNYLKKNRSRMRYDEYLAAGCGVSPTCQERA